MTQHLDQELSAYLDDELDATARVAVDAHLAECAACRETLDALRRVVRRAQALDDRPPARDLWSGIADRLTTPDTADVVPIASRRRVALSLPQLAAAAVALVALSAAATGVFLRRGAAPAVAAADSAPAVRTAALPADVVAQSYDSVIRELERLVAERRGTLDTSTVRTIERSLALIDAAIAQARAALERDPDNTYLNGHLRRTLDRKLDVLRQAALLTAAS
jgi:anti-sigma factor RsiW